ncbi:MAG: type II secretion system protein [Bdellovibrionia bacterium]
MNNRRGMTLIEVLLAVGVASILMAGGFYLMTSGQKMNVKAEALFWLTDLRSNIIKTLKNSDGFKAVALNAANPALSCLKEKIENPVAKVNCQDQLGFINIVVDSQGKELVNTVNANSGFNLKGLPCGEFSETDPNDNCPFRYELQWRAVCSNEGCSSPDSVIEGRLKVALKRKDMAINPSLHAFNIFIPSEGEKNITTCEQSLLGQFNEATQMCQLNLTRGCPAGQYVIGFRSDGRPNCASVNPVKGGCTGKKRLRGVDGAGNAICVNWCR